MFFIAHLFYDLIPLILFFKLDIITKYLIAFSIIYRDFYLTFFQFRKLILDVK